MKVDENQTTGSIYNFGEYNTESKVLSKAEKEKIKYWTDDKFRARKTNTLKENTGRMKEYVPKNYVFRKYQDDEEYRNALIESGIYKYQEDKGYRDALIQSGIEKYLEDPEYREKLKQASIVKYKEDENHKEHVKQASIKKYADDDAHRIKIKQQTSVQICKKEYYDNSIFDLVTTDKYQHKCTDDCKTNCAFEGTCRTSLWICYTCHRKMLKGKIPADSFSNSLLLENVPVELKQLNSIEQQLIAQNIPFMKIMALPKGGQKGVHGPVVCVPSDLKKVTSILPRSENESLLLKVKLKRKLSYKGYDKYQFVRPNHLEQALLYLKDQNIWYKDVAINNEWINPIPELNDDQVVNDESESDDTELLDTCLQPADIGQEALDLCFDQVFNIAPAENTSPLSVLQESGIEAKTFPVHFPTGKNTFDEIRDEKLTIGRYFNLRLMSVENRFARDTSYIFFSQYLTELNSVISNVQISLRKECPFSKEGNKITGEMLCNKETLKESVFKKDEAIKYLKPIRGTPPYWQSSQKDIFAMIRQLGVPTFFCSFSSADFRWSEIVNTILKQQGDMRNTENMTWDEKCKVLCSNPVTAARMFNHRFQYHF
ncbi:Hypothetical predicted protein [Mytilus galloprovincialis]|uniref:Helitron helicase-like domain-containing protein n=1 Tax=Mytilus galloprovincialis TaxID=29158 RepID=A0A8B6CZS6_MYTGA|nr:Hypothetical predicted protein [Mytilus galloprovincialis]